MNYLEAILSRKYLEVERRRRFASLLVQYEHELDRCGNGVSRLAPNGGVAAVLKKPHGELPRVIAEVKFKSPSKGVIRKRTAGAPRAIALEYERGGASMVSVLCDRPGFFGTPLDVRRVAEAVTLPVLYKEFVIDPLQVRWARIMGAGAVLLIVRALSQMQLCDLVNYAMSLGLEPIVEAADEVELGNALNTHARCIGINARDLRSFQMDSNLAHALVASIPNDRTAIYMSGIEKRADILGLRTSRADAVLVGESLMRSDNPADILRQWLTD